MKRIVVLVLFGIGFLNSCKKEQNTPDSTSTTTTTTVTPPDYRLAYEGSYQYTATRTVANCLSGTSHDTISAVGNISRNTTTTDEVWIDFGWGSYSVRLSQSGYAMFDFGGGGLIDTTGTSFSMNYRASQTACVQDDRIVNAYKLP